METAPRTGEEIEALFDGEWLPVYWGHADDGSPHGTEGWAQVDGGYLIDSHPAGDLEAWRPLNSLEYGEPSALNGHSLRQPLIVLGLAFGDEAKGATVDYLSSAISDTAAVVRWSGGANAAHNVRHGHRHHSFRQFGSGSFLGIPTFLTEDVVVNPQMLMEEAVQLEALGVHSPLSLMAIHEDALVTTPIHIALNRAREIIRENQRHGSCGVGIGETIVHSYADRNWLSMGEMVGNFEIPGATAEGAGVLTVGMIAQGHDSFRQNLIVSALRHQDEYAEHLIRQARELAPEYADELVYGSFDAIAQELIAVVDCLDVLSPPDFDRELLTLMEQGTVIFEGSQGLLLDEYWGFHPHTTWSRTQPSALVEWLRDKGHQPYVLGLTRSFTTRHGDGPLPSGEVSTLTEYDLPEDDNGWGLWQGDFRNAPLDIPLLRYSKRILLKSGVDLDGVGISHLDAFGSEKVPAVIAYGSQKDPSRLWNFEADRKAGQFARVNSDVFLENMVLSKDAELLEYNADDLPVQLSIALGVPVVLSADGPTRNDRRHHKIRFDGK